MSLISLTKPLTDGTTAYGSDVKTDLDIIVNDYNGNITNANIASGAAITDSKLAQISTSAKVAVSALTVGSQATGDILYASSASAWARLGVGTSSQTIIGGTIPAWGSLPIPAGTTIQTVNTTTSTLATNTNNNIPRDNTKPQSGEGASYMTRAITAAATGNLLKVTVVWNGSSSVDQRIIVAVFQGASADAAGAIAIRPTSSDSAVCISFVTYVTAGTTSAQTFTVKAGGDSNSTITFNGEGGSQLFNGVMASSITIDEVKA